MSTRACYIFKDQDREFTVYVHCDGYPSWAWRYFADTIASGIAWPLPRWEADEFGAAFIAVNKTRPGSVRLVKKWNDHDDLSYLYKLTMSKGNVLIIKVEAVSAPMNGSLKPSRWKRKTIYHGPLHRFIFARGDLTEASSRSTGLKIDRINDLLQEGAVS